MHCAGIEALRENLARTREEKALALKNGSLQHYQTLLQEAAKRNNLLGEIAPPFVFTSHEGLLLEYEDALTREDTKINTHVKTVGTEEKEEYCLSAHLLWIGDRTR